MQSRLESLIEVSLNVIIGWLTAIITQIIVFPLFGIHITFIDQFWISFIFTSIAIIRGYTIRRWFNRRLHNMAVQLAEKVR